MATDKIGFNPEVLKNIPPYEYNTNKTVAQWANEIPAKANEITNDYYGLGVMVVLFSYLVWKLGSGLQEINEQFTRTRALGISAGVVAIIGVQFINIGFFTVYYHVVIFIGILLVTTIMLYLQER